MGLMCSHPLNTGGVWVLHGMPGSSWERGGIYNVSWFACANSHWGTRWFSLKHSNKTELMVLGSWGSVNPCHLLKCRLLRFWLLFMIRGVIDASRVLIKWPLHHYGENYWVRYMFFHHSYGLAWSTMRGLILMLQLIERLLVLVLS